jgi:transcriptional regulator with XRE-family HTH domain
MDLGARIRATRLRYGMSQAELARRIRTSTTTMNQIESGKTPDPGVLKVKAIAQVLQVSMDALLGLTEDESDGEAAGVA